MLLTENTIWIFILSLLIISFMYSSIGHGGASGYLALMAIFNFSPEMMRPTGLILNLFVSGIAFYHFWKSGYFNKKLFLIFSISSMPLSFIGGTLIIDTTVYKVTLGIILLFSIVRIISKSKNENKTKPINIPLGIIIGGLIGFLSGMIGIGGGIILSPIILLLSWGKIKESAAVSALFIWVNSAAGLLGQYSNEIELSKYIWIYILMVLIGGYFGSYISAKYLSNKLLKGLLSLIIISASLKLILF